jgi:carbon storage regulator
MLVLSRRVGEKLRLGDDIVLTINRINGNRVRIAIEAPRDVPVLRDELKPFPKIATETLPSDCSTLGFSDSQ